ncbi:MAG: YhcH/YjgK/YiaL family protein [Lacunisphaera sp.]|nr:YhcH/YjgK/YiaL family protein [Lacunisphaera sp.]
MILDTLAQADQYNAISPRFAEAFAFLRQFTGEAKLGRHEIRGEEIFALVQQYVTAPLPGKKYESHRRYMDIQYVHRGHEAIYWAPLARLKSAVRPYDRAEDAALYNLDGTDTPVLLLPGQFAIFLPEDGHIPGCAWNSPAEVLKVVVKVKVDDAYSPRNP